MMILGGGGTLLVLFLMLVVVPSMRDVENEAGADPGENAAAGAVAAAPVPIAGNAPRRPLEFPRPGVRNSRRFLACRWR